MPITMIQNLWSNSNIDGLSSIIQIHANSPIRKTTKNFWQWR